MNNLDKIKNGLRHQHKNTQNVRDCLIVWGHFHGSPTLRSTTASEPSVGDWESARLREKTTIHASQGLTSDMAQDTGILRRDPVQWSPMTDTVLLVRGTVFPVGRVMRGGGFSLIPLLNSQELWGYT